jgi:Domain of unknown function (DUF4124)
VRRPRLAPALLVLMLAAPGAAAQMYKCVDARGVTHYADEPTPGCRNAAVDIRGSPPLSGRLAPGESAAEQEADFRRRQMEHEQVEQGARASRAADQRRCAGLRRERAVLASGRRLVQLDAQGERVYVDDTVRERRLAEVQAALQSCR